MKPMSSSRPSYADIARVAGVSKATVSLAMRRHPRISRARQEEIHRIATELGYRPNPLYTNLLSQVRRRSVDHSGVVLAMVDFSSSQTQSSMRSFRAPLVEGIRERAEQYGYRTDTLALRDLGRPGLKRLQSIITHRALRGLIVLPASDYAGPVSLPWEHLAAVAIGYSLPQVQAHRVVGDQFQNMLTVLRQLQDRGYRRIGFCCHARTHAVVRHHWGAAFLWWQLESGVGVEPADVWTTQVYDSTELIRWIRERELDALVTENASLATVLPRAGFAVPDELGIARINLHAEDDESAGVLQLPSEVGACAVDVLSGLLNNHTYGIPERPQTTIVEGHWVDGATVRPLTSSQAY